MKLKHKKVTHNSGIPVKVLKKTFCLKEKAFCRISLHIFFNETIESSKFPTSLKQANITPVFKKGSRNQKENYRPVSILPIISKIFEMALSKQLYIYFENMLSKFQCGFRKIFSTRYLVLNTVYH